MADVKNGAVKIVLGGKERKLKYTLYSLTKLEEKGVKMTDLGKEMSMGQILAVIWAGLITFDKKITVEEVGSMIGIEEIPMVTEKLSEAFMGVQGKE